MKIVVLVCVLAFPNALYGMHDPAANPLVSSKLTELRSNLEVLKASVIKLQGSLQNLQAAFKKSAGTGGAGDHPPTPPGGGAPGNGEPTTLLGKLPKELISIISSYNIKFDFSSADKLYDSIKNAQKELPNLIQVSTAPGLAQELDQISIISGLFKQQQGNGIVITDPYDINKKKEIPKGEILKFYAYNIMSRVRKEKNYFVCKILFAAAQNEEEFKALCYAGLAYAFDKNDAESVQMILNCTDRKKGVAWIEEGGWLIELVRVGTPEMIKSVLDDFEDKAKAIMLFIPNRGANTFFYAASLNDAKKVQAILEALSDKALETIMRQDEDGFTILHYAVLKNNFEMVRVILKVLGINASQVIMMKAKPRYKIHGSLHKANGSGNNFRLLRENTTQNYIDMFREKIKGDYSSTDKKFTALDVAVVLDLHDIANEIIDYAGDKMHLIAMQNPIKREDFFGSTLFLAQVHDDNYNGGNIFQKMLSATGKDILYAAVVDQRPDLRAYEEGINSFFELDSPASNDRELVKVLLGAFGDKAQQVVLAKRDWFLEAVKAGRLDVVRELLQVARDKASDLVKVKDSDGNTAFDLVSTGTPEMKNLLDQYKAK